LVNIERKIKKTPNEPNEPNEKISAGRYNFHEFIDFMKDKMVLV
jgi:hypothetical protein